MRKAVSYLFSALLVLAIFYFLGKEFARNWGEIRNFNFQFDISLLLLGSVAYAATLAILAVGWWLLLRYVCCPVPFFQTLLYFFITFPVRYVPGKIWIAVARMKFLKPEGVANSVTLLTTGAEAMLEIFAGAYISIIALLQTDIFGNYSLVATIGFTALGLVFLVPKVFYFFMNLYLRIVKQEPIEPARRVTFSKLFLLQALYVVAMAGIGISQLLFLVSFVSIPSGNFAFIISIGAFSYVASIIAVFAPSGLGVREGVWYLTLKSLVAPHISIVYAFASRLWTIIIEALLLFLALPILLIRKRNAHHPLE